MQKYQYSSNPTVTAWCYVLWMLYKTTYAWKGFSQTRGRKEKEHFQCYKRNIKIKKQTNQPTTKFETGIHKFLEKVYATNKIPKQQSSAV